MEHALMNMIPFQNGSSESKEELVRLELRQILQMLENPTVMTQLARFPHGIVSLSSVLSKMTFESSFSNALVDIYHFLSAQGDLDQAFFDNCLPILQMALQICNSVEGVLEILRELVCIIRASPPNPKRSELKDRLQAILKKTDKKVEWYAPMNKPLPFVSRDESVIRRRIACCELEWLVLHSSLSNDDAALAFDLSLRSFRQKLRCFTLHDVQIEAGSFAFVPEKTRSEMVTSIVAAGSMSCYSSATQPVITILTPVLIAQRVIYHVKRVLEQGDHAEFAILLWNLAFDSRPFKCGSECASSCSFLDYYIEAFLAVLAESSSVKMMLYWAELDKHHFCQCSDVILKACTWYGRGEETDTEVVLNFQNAVGSTLNKMITMVFAYLPGYYSSPLQCFRLLKRQLKHLGNMLDSRLSTKVTTAILQLLSDSQAGDTVVEILSYWPCKERAADLVESVQLCCQEERLPYINRFGRRLAWQLLKSFGRFSMNSPKSLVSRFKDLVALCDLGDAHGIEILPKWREVMIEEGFAGHAIDCWCVAFLTTPLEDLSVRDLQVIFDLNSQTLELVAPVSQRIKNCIFPEDGFGDTREGGIEESQTKERLRLARLLSEFINILRPRKSEENPKHPGIGKVVVEACDELCRAFENGNRTSVLYKINRKNLKALFTEVFGGERRYDKEVDCVSIICTDQGGERETRGFLTPTKQSECLFESLPPIPSRKEVYEPLLILLRRWLSGIGQKSALASCTLEIVRILFSVHSPKKGSELLEELHDIVQASVLSFKNNQALVAQLQAAGYNQKTQGALDLWCSPSVECAGYLSKREVLGSRSLRKKLTEVLRRHWNEW